MLVINKLLLIDKLAVYQVDTIKYAAESIKREIKVLAYWYLDLASKGIGQIS